MKTKQGDLCQFDGGKVLVCTYANQVLGQINFRYATDDEITLYYLGIKNIFDRETILKALSS